MHLNETSWFLSGMSRSVYVELSVSKLCRMHLCGNILLQIYLISDILAVFARKVSNVVFLARMIFTGYGSRILWIQFYFSQRVQTIGKFKRKFVINDVYGWVIYNTKGRRGAGSIPRIWRQIINFKGVSMVFLKKEKG